jgi:hypothetical protein
MFPAWPERPGRVFNRARDSNKLSIFSAFLLRNSLSILAVVFYFLHVGRSRSGMTAKKIFVRETGNSFFLIFDMEPDD